MKGKEELLDHLVHPALIAPAALGPAPAPAQRARLAPRQPGQRLEERRVDLASLANALLAFRIGELAGECPLPAGEVLERRPLGRERRSLG